MKKCLTVLLSALLFVFSDLQAQNFWTAENPDAVTNVREIRYELPVKFRVFKLDLEEIKTALQTAPMRGVEGSGEEVILAFPTASGNFRNYRIIEAPVFDAELSALYPEIKSYAGQGIENPTEVIRFSLSPKGLKSMLLSSEHGYEFIEPYSEDYKHYFVYRRADRAQTETDFECEVKHTASEAIEQGGAKNNADDGVLRTYRLAVSTNGEYTAYHGGTVADALDAINTSMTRVNGLFEMDFNVTMTLIANTTDVIYTNASTDPYSSGSWNGQLQSTLTTEIGEANYDVGHLFAQGGNNGNAGCIGCVCVNGSKGSAFTSRTTPEGDPFDVDYVAHELGHQYGGNHTWTFNGNEGTNVQMEPGSGSTIMGYAGITGATDVQANSDPYFHAVTIEQITDYVKSTSCQVNTNTGNTTPTADAGINYTIPRGTPFILTGAGSDADGDAITYCWEQMDENNASTTNPSVTATSGVAFRSFNPSTSNQRTFPVLETVLAGNTSSAWEAVPNVARDLNFRLTVRDNRAGGGSNESDNMIVSVNAATGPFMVTQPNSLVAWEVGTTKTVTWDVAGTSGSPINTSNVNILLSTDGGQTFPTTLVANTPNDGTEDIIVPNMEGDFTRIKIEAVGNIYFDISDTNFTIGTNLPITYCASNGNDVSDEYIGNFTLGSINNTTGASGTGYADYTTQSTDITIGETENFSITPVWTGPTYNEGYAIWIDYNRNGDFTDSGELVFSQAPSSTNPVTGSFIVPGGITTGTTRMRVSLKYNGVPDPCESFSYGEVEDYTVNVIAAALPVDWLDFTATARDNNSVVLEWSTGTEKNTEEFIIERSQNGRDFTEIARQSAAGNSETARSYADTDNNPYLGRSYYRIRQTDTDGAFSFSPIRSVFIADQGNLIALYPNPTAQGQPVQIVSEVEQDIQVELFNAAGQAVLRQFIPGGRGEIELQGLPVGAYFYRLTGSEGTEAGRLLLK